MRKVDTCFRVLTSGQAGIPVWWQVKKGEVVSLSLLTEWLIASGSLFSIFNATDSQVPAGLKLASAAYTNKERSTNAII